MEKPVISQLMTQRGWLLRGESVVASSGLALAFILLAAMATGAWWTLRTERIAIETRQREQTHSVGSLLSQSAESLLLANELSTVRRMVADTGRSNGFTVCRIILDHGQIVADADPSKINVHRLPATWSGASQAVEDTSTSQSILRFPLELPGRGTAILELSIVEAPPTWRAWEAHAGLGVIGAGCMLGLLLIYRRMRIRLRAMGAIRDALLSKHAGEQSLGALAVNTEGVAPEAQAWNELIAENQSLREQVLLEHVQDSKSGSGGSNDLEGVCDAMWQGLLLVDESLRITYSNGAAAILLRSKRDQMLGREISTFSIDQALLDPIRKVVNGTVRRRITTEVRLEQAIASTQADEASESDSANRRSDDASPSDAQASAKPLNPSFSILRFNVRPVRRGDMAAAMVIIEDITQQRLAEESRNAFVAQATHELRMPLTNIRLYTESALDEGERDVVLRAKCLNVINQESKRLERIVGDMLSVAEIEAGTLKLRPGDVRLDSLFEELRNDYEAHAREKSVALTFNLPPKLPAIRGDRDKIVLALHNLIGNAIKYTASGGSVDVTVEITDKQLIVDVSDTGIGIRQEETELIFEKFYRAKDERIADITGSGLGLAVARDVMRMHRGDISVRSELNEGSTFTLTVPTLLEAA